MLTLAESPFSPPPAAPQRTSITRSGAGSSRLFLPPRALFVGLKKKHFCSLKRALPQDAEETTKDGDSKSTDDAESWRVEGVSKSEDGSSTGKEVQESLEVASGSPLPGIKASGDTRRISKNVLEVLRDQVFGFDTFFVTNQEPYEGGVLFKGNLRGDASRSFSKINSRLQDKFGDEYKLFLLLSPDDDKPVAIVTPKQLVEPDPATVPEWAAASLFGLVTLFTILLRHSPSLQVDLLSAFQNFQLISEGIPGALVTLVTLAAHEGGHIYAAQSVGGKLGIPYLVPSLQLGSFGPITRVTNILRSREDLLKIAAAGPLAGASLSLIILLTGFILSQVEGQGITINATAFHESFIVGALAKLFLGDTLKEGATLTVNPLVLWAWAGLLINGINSIPVGELDGGRISQAIWGRKVWSRVNGVSVALLGFSALFSDVALYWVVLVLFLQRGPITPQSEEISSPDNVYKAAGIAVLFLSLLVCLPFPFSFS